ncbi:MAG: cobyrinate a,c-diamide synthase [Bacillota bacterium]
MSIIVKASEHELQQNKPAMAAVPRVVLAAPHGRSGKTTLTIGLVAALVDLGFAVQAFKKGPDYIDPSWLTQVAGRPCRNLDCFFLTEAQLRESLVKAAAFAGITVVEGAMGMYDGLDLEGTGSTAQLAKIIKAPVLLVVDCTRMTRSVAALVKGFMEFDPEVAIKGVILNRVARSRHEKMLREAVETYCGLPVVGALPKSDDFVIPDRHLGLIPAGENEALFQRIEFIRQAVKRHTNLEQVVEIARQAPPLHYSPGVTGFAGKTPCVTVGVIRDRAFTFYYPENLEFLEENGGQIRFIDALNDKELPPVDALYIGGGFPEVFARDLAANHSLRQSIRKKIDDGLPVYAECGGLMYLGREIVVEGQSYPMVGALPFRIVMEKKPQGHGYTLMETTGANPFWEEGQLVKGHEFHNSRVIDLEREQVEFAYRVKKGFGIDGCWDGVVYKNVLAGYNHLHAHSDGSWLKNLIKRGGEWRRRRGSS